MLERLYVTYAMGPHAKCARLFSCVDDVTSHYASLPASQRPLLGGYHCFYGSGCWPSNLFSCSFPLSTFDPCPSHPLILWTLELIMFLLVGGDSLFLC